MTGRGEVEPQSLTTDEVCRVVGRRARELRRAQGWSLEQLARRSGLSLGMLSKIEHGQTSPSLATLTALANALEAPLTSFFRGLDDEHDAVIVPAGGGIEIAAEADGPGATSVDLGALRGRQRGIEPVMVTITDADTTFPRVQHAGVELIHVVAGVVEYGYGTKRYRLGPGDTMQFHGEVPHGPVDLVELPIQYLSLKVQSA